MHRIALRLCSEKILFVIPPRFFIRAHLRAFAVQSILDWILDFGLNPRVPRFPRGGQVASLHLRFTVLSSGISGDLRNLRIEKTFHLLRS